MDFLSSGTEKLGSRCREVAVSGGSTVLRVLIFFCGFGFQTTLPYIIRNALLMQSTLRVHYLFSFLHTAHILCLVKE